MIYRRSASVKKAFCVPIGHACFFFLLCIALRCPSASAQSPNDFTTYSLEELMNMELTTAAKKPQKAYESAAAVFVITQEDIRRSGATNLPEALRMAPGIQVARSDPGDFAVTSRGFLGEFANKLLVLIDGRSIYSPVFSGTFWDYNDMLLENIERIEVIRGPGATLWGANAVNGVINIITKNAKDMQGGMAVATVSSQEGYDALRYGVKLRDNMYLSSYVKRMDFGNVINDKWRNEPRQVNGGARLDWAMTDQDKLLVTAGYFDFNEATKINRPVLTPSLEMLELKTDADFSGGHALCRWEHTFSATSEMKLQLFYNGYEANGTRRTSYKPAQDSRELRKDPSRVDTCDADFQHSFAIGSRNSIIWGLNTRYSRVKKEDINIYVALASETETQRLYSAFAQDEIQLVPERLSLIIGSKFEYNSSTQLEVQPSVRMLYTPSDTQSFWGAVSRAVRTPSVVETKGRIRAAFFEPGSLFPLSPPGVAEMQGNEDYDSENLIAYEVGHRFKLAPDFSLDTALYYNVYDDLRTLEPSSPQLKKGYFIIPVQADNKMRGRSYGAEIAATWQALPRWRLQATGSHLRLNLTPEKSSRDTVSEKDEDLSSQNLFTLRSLYSITPALELDVSLYFADSIERLNNPSSADLTVRLGWKPFKNLILEGIGYNLIDNKHKGFRDEIYAYSQNRVRRAFYCRITVEF